MNRRILNLAIPNIISNITIPLLGLVDIALLGHLGSEVYIGAIAIGVMIFNFIFWGFGFLRMGTSGFTAQAYGSRDFREMILILSRSMLVAMAASGLILVLQKPIALLSFHLINGSSEVESLAARYFYIRIWSVPATLAIYAFTGWFLGMQNARFPMIIAIVVNILNIGLNIIFVYVLEMKSNGVAFGNVIAQFAGVILATFLFWRYYRRLIKYWEYRLMIQWAALKRFFMVNRDILIRTLCLIFTFSFFTASSASQNDTILAVNTILLQFFFIMSYLVDGFAFAGEALVGKYVGAKDNVNLKKSIKYLFIWGLLIGLFFTVIYAVGSQPILHILTNNASIIGLAKIYIYWVILIPLLTFPAFIWDGVYIGATAAAPMRNSLLAATLLVFLPAYFIAKPYIGNHGLWLAMMLFMIGRGLFLTLYARRAIYSRIIS